MIRVPPQIAAIIASLWGLGIAATTQITLPSWAHFAITAVGIILAGIGILPTNTVSEAAVGPPYPIGLDHVVQPQAAPPPAASPAEKGLS